MKILSYDEFIANRNDDGSYAVKIVMQTEDESGAAKPLRIEIPRASFEKLVNITALESLKSAEDIVDFVAE